MNSNSQTDELEVRDLATGDAQSLVDLFLRCYGDSYGTRLFYDPARLAEAITTGQLRSVIVVSDKTVVGHTGISIRYPDASICETGNTVVDPAMRGKGLLKRLGDALRQRVLNEGFTGYMHYPTTAHEIMQKASVTGGGKETGLMLAYIPEVTHYEGINQSPGRLAATVAFQPFTDTTTATVLVPGAYGPLLQQIYEHAGIPRTINRAVQQRDAPGEHCTIEYNADRQLLRCFVDVSGAPPLDKINEAMALHQPHVAHVDLVLDRNVEAAISGLRKAGFFFCALLPGFARSDVLRLQRLRDPAAEVFAPAIVGDQAKRLLAFMREETGH